MKQLLYLLTVLFVAPLSAQKVPDVFTGQFYGFSNRVLKPKIDKPWVVDEIEITCYQFQDPLTPVQRKINANLQLLCTARLQTEDSYIKAERQATIRQEQYNKILNSRSYGQYGTAGRPHLKYIACNVISVAGGKALAELCFKYEFSTPNGNSANINARWYYTVHLQTGAILPWKPQITNANNKAIRTLIKDVFCLQYTLAKEKNNTKVSYDGQEIINNCEEAFAALDLRHADFYWLHWGLMVQFQEYMPGTESVNGRFFRLFFPYKKALQITALMPEFAYINSLPPVKNNFVNYKFYDASKCVSQIRTAPDLENIIAVNRKIARVKSVSCKNVQVYENGKRELRGTETIQYSPLGEIIFSESADDRRFYVSQKEYEYDKQNRLLKMTGTEYPNKKVLQRYEYDGNSNLVHISREGSENENTSMFYNGNYAYLLSYSLFKANEIHCQYYELTKASLRYEDVTYQLGANRNITGVISTNNRSTQQLGFDKQGRLSESHFDHDRDNFYFNYDSAGRFVSLVSYDGTKKKQEIKFIYKNDSPFPAIIGKYTESANMEQELEWEFY